MEWLQGERRKRKVEERKLWSEVKPGRVRREREERKKKCEKQRAKCLVTNRYGCQER